MSDVTTLRAQMCDIGRRMWEQGYVAANDGNLSVRLDDDHFLCTPTLISKGFMRPEDLIIVNAAGEKVEGRRESTSEIKMHLAIYRADPTVMAVAHAHPPTATAYAITEIPLPQKLLPEFEFLLGPVPLADFATPGTHEVAENVVAKMQPGINTMLLSHHGAVGFDATLELAYFHIETLENYCKVLAAIHHVGPAVELTDSQMAAILESKKAAGLPDPRHI